MLGEPLDVVLLGLPVEFRVVEVARRARLSVRPWSPQGIDGYSRPGTGGHPAAAPAEEAAAAVVALHGL